MSDSKYRIPRMTLAVMVLGAGCDDGNGEGGLGDISGRGFGEVGGETEPGGESGVSDDRIARLTRIASKLCDPDRPCDWEDADPPPFTSEQACVDSYVQELKAFFEELDESCGAAYLSYYECYVSVYCGEGDAATLQRCYRSGELVEQRCEGMLDDDHVDLVED